MVTVAPPFKPLLLLNLYLDTGIANYAGKSIDFRRVAFKARVISWGTIDRSIPLPAGEMQISDATVRVADTDGQIKAWIDQITPFRRLGEVILEDENHADDGGQIELPLVSNDSDSDIIPSYDPLFTGEIIDANFPMGEVEFKLKSVTAAWLGRAIERLLTRDNFPNLPDDIESGFVPIIYGRNFSYTGTGYDPQGVIPCVHVDTSTNDYIVARHSCYSVPAVYRKRPLDQRFTLVSPSEYTLPVVDYTILGRVYNMQMIRFTLPQYDGTLINADVSGANFRWDFSTNSQVSGEVRNPIDCLVNLIYYTLQNETRIETFDGNTFEKVRGQCTDLDYFCDGAITGAVNSAGTITAGTAVTRICSSFLIDFIQNEQSRLQVRLYQAEDADELIIPIDSKVTLLKTLHPGLPRKVATRLRYRYAHQNAPLTEYVKSANAAQWGFEHTIDHVADQEELARTGANPLIEGEVIELYFVRDDTTAKNVVKRRIPYHTLRSYELSVELPAPELVRSLYLGAPIEITHFFGIGDGGWVNKRMRVDGLLFDLSTYKLRADAVCIPTVDDADLDFSFDGSHDSHAAQTRKPQFPVGVNAATPTTAPKSINLSSVPSAPAGRANVVWTEDATTEPRTVRGHVPLTVLPTDCALDKYDYYTGDYVETNSDMTVEEAFDDVGAAFADVAQATSDIYGHVYFTPDPNPFSLPPSWVDDIIANIYSNLLATGYYGVFEVNANLQDIADDLQAEIEGIISGSGFATTGYVDAAVAAEDAALRGDPPYTGTLSELDGRITGLDTDLTTAEGDISTAQGHITDLLAHTFFDGEWVDYWVDDIYSNLFASGTYGSHIVVDGNLQEVADDLQEAIDDIITGSGFATVVYVDNTADQIYDYIDNNFYTAAQINYKVTHDWKTIYDGYYQPIGSYATTTALSNAISAEVTGRNSAISTAVSDYNTTLRGGYVGSLNSLAAAINTVSTDLGNYLLISEFNTAIANYFTIDEINTRVTGDWLYIYSTYFADFDYVDNSIVALANDVGEEFIALRGSPPYFGTLSELDGRITGLDTDLDAVYTYLNTEDTLTGYPAYLVELGFCTGDCSGGGGGGITQDEGDARYILLSSLVGSGYSDLADLAGVVTDLVTAMGCEASFTESNCY